MCRLSDITSSGRRLNGKGKWELRRPGNKERATEGRRKQWVPLPMSSRAYIPSFSSPSKNQILLIDTWTWSVYKGYFLHLVFAVYFLRDTLNNVLRKTKKGKRCKFAAFTTGYPLPEECRLGIGIYCSFVSFSPNHSKTEKEKKHGLPWPQTRVGDFQN